MVIYPEARKYAVTTGNLKISTGNQNLGRGSPSKKVMQVPLRLAWGVKPSGAAIFRGHEDYKCPSNVTHAICKSSNSVCLSDYDRGYICFCEGGYDGNPYITGNGGCQGTYIGLSTTLRYIQRV